MMEAFCLCSWVQRDPLIQPQEAVMSPAGPVEHSGPQQLLQNPWSWTLLSWDALPPDPLPCHITSLSLLLLLLLLFYFFFLLLLPVLFWVPWDHFSTLTIMANLSTMLTFFPWPASAPLGYDSPPVVVESWGKKGWSSLEVGLFANSHPPANSQKQGLPPPPVGLSFLQSGKVEKGLTHRVINSFPMLKDSPRKPLLAWVATSCQNWWVKVNNLAFKPLFLKSANVI